MDVQPRYDREFRCIGPDCEDHCCNNWYVAIDKTTYAKYQSIPRLKPLVDQYVQIRNTASDSRYAQIQFPAPSHECPFLTTDRWCSIHKEYGPSYLATVCLQYPRVQEARLDMTEVPFYLSCPEAARLVLLQPNLVPIDRNRADDRPDYRRFLRMADQSIKQHAYPMRTLYSDIRSFSLVLIQDRAYPLWQRLFVLGMFSKRLTEVENNPNEFVPKLLSEYAGLVKQERLRSVMDGVGVQTTQQLGAVIEVAHRLQTEHASAPRIQDCIRDFMRGIRYDPHSPIESLARFYTEAYEHYYQPFFDKYPFILENYLSNYVFWTQFPGGPFPAGEPNTPLTAYFLMCLKYAVIKGLLIGMAGHYRDAFAVEHVLKLVQCFSKIAEHSPGFLRGLNHNLVGAAGMALLLRN